MIDHKRMLRLVFSVALATFISGCGMWETRRDPPPPPALSADELRSEAEQGLPQFFRELRARLGQPYEMYTLNTTSTSRYRDGGRLLPLLERQHEWEFPVIVDDYVIGTTRVDARGGHRHQVSNNNGTTWEILLQWLSYPEHQALGTPVLVDCGPPFGRFALFGKGLDEQILPLSDSACGFTEHKNAKPYPAPKDLQVYPSDKVIPVIKKAYDLSTPW